jgi:hypothetical protein
MPDISLNWFCLFSVGQFFTNRLKFLSCSIINFSKCQRLPIRHRAALLGGTEILRGLKSMSLATSRLSLLKSSKYVDAMSTTAAGTTTSWTHSRRRKSIDLFFLDRASQFFHINCFRRRPV